MNPAIKATIARPPTTPNTIARVELVVPVTGNALLIALLVSTALFVSTLLLTSTLLLVLEETLVLVGILKVA